LEWGQHSAYQAVREAAAKVAEAGSQARMNQQTLLET
jgi:hypothetical protein